ncbi:hypothetical protein SEA_EMOTION_39 [Arthrobacter phage Emotion]|uniref:Uncharacterized protein n=1 Tax=Arthrobacter phage Emotion TaxID=3038361 RepID=A0AA49ILS7_9CAUD|nr:hypothetical protein SEA_EMOTION_39 [Arthrobacter phage Emotion]
MRSLEPVVFRLAIYALVAVGHRENLETVANVLIRCYMLRSGVSGLDRATSVRMYRLGWRIRRAIQERYGNE